MKTLKLIVAFSFILLIASMAYPQSAVVSFRTGALPATWCPILGDDLLPLADGSYVGIYLAGANLVPDPPMQGTGAPTGDDVQPTGNNINFIALHAGEPVFVPPGNIFQMGNIMEFPPAGTGPEPIAEIGDLVYLRAFNSPDPATGSHYNDIITVNGASAVVYTPGGSGPATVIVCFGDAILYGGGPEPCVPQEAAGPEAAMIPMGSTHYFFGETVDDHCTLWIDATGGAVNVTEAVLVDAEPPCKPYPMTTYMTRYFELNGVPDSFFDVYFGYSQADYDASDFGVDESMLHVAYWDGELVGCVGEWVKTYPIPALITDDDQGGYAQVTTDHMSLWSFGWDGGETQLPVELTSFEALAGDRSAILNWTTASETNNDGFFIERSTDGENFVRVSQLIEGAGTSPNSNDYTYNDNNLNNGVHYTYRLIDRDINGMEYVNEMTAEVTPSFLGEAIVITEYKLHQNYPNPFNPSTNLIYDVLDQGMVTLKVYNVMGQEVTQLVNQPRENGRYAVSFDATGLSSGIYFYTVKVNNFTDTKKMLLVQ